MNIPPITDPLGRYWDQPPISSITFYRGKAIMSKKTFLALCEYSTTMPSGVYQGKMWRANKNAWPIGGPKFTTEWFLRWYGPSDKPNHVSTNQVPIELAECDMAEQDIAGSA